MQSTYTVGSHFGIISRVEPSYRVVENCESVWRHLAVILDTLQPEPDCISAVVACTPAAAQQVRDEAVT